MADTIYEHRITKGGRKTWDGEPHLDEEGWEEYQEWERFDYHEERYWRRPLTGDALEAELGRRARSDRRQAVKDKERAVIEAAKAYREAWMLERGDGRRELALLLEAVEDLLGAEGKPYAGMTVREADPETVAEHERAVREALQEAEDGE